MPKRRSKAAQNAAAQPAQHLASADDAPDLATASGVVVFLDVDGVLLPFSRGSTLDADDAGEPMCGRFPARCLAAFESVVAAAPRATLVLSSTWRCDPAAVAELLEAFGEYGGALARVAADGFVHTTALDHHTERQHEIARWLSEAHAAGFDDDAADDDDTRAARAADAPRARDVGAIRAWVALDDEELVTGERNRRLRARFEGRARTIHSATGLTDDDARAHLGLLREQLRLADARATSPTRRARRGR